jgi:hypothetical protein
MRLGATRIEAIEYETSRNHLHGHFGGHAEWFMIGGPSRLSRHGLDSTSPSNTKACRADD